MTTYELKRSVLQLKTKTVPHSFALYSGERGDQILITAKRPSARDVARIAPAVGDAPERRCRGVCLFQGDVLTFKTKTKWNAVLEHSMVKILRREGLGKFVPPWFLVVGEGEALGDEEGAGSAAGAGGGSRAVGERIERLSGGNPRLTRLAGELLAEVERLESEGRAAEAAERRAYLDKVLNALVRTPEAIQEPKVDPAAVMASTATAQAMPHPRGKGGAVDFPSEEEFYDAFGQFRPKFRTWVRLVERGQPKLFDAQAAVDQARARYAERRSQGERALRAAMARDFPGQLRALNARQPRVNTLVLETAAMPAQESSSARKLEAARSRVHAALKGVAAAALDIHILELKDSIDDLEARRKALQATIDRNIGLAQTFLSAALEGPLAIKGLLVQEAQGAALSMASTVLAGVFSDKERAELDKVQARLDVEKRKLKQAERDRLGTLLDKAKAELESETHALYAASDDAWLARRRADNNYAEIATLGANGGVQVFQELKRHRGDMQRLWSEYTDAVDELSYLLQAGPLSLAYKSANERIKTIKEARAQHFAAGGDKTDEDALILSDMSGHYKRFADWYWGELQKYKRVGQELARSEHGDVLAEVLRAAEQALNG